MIAGTLATLGPQNECAPYALNSPISSPWSAVMTIAVSSKLRGDPLTSNVIIDVANGGVISVLIQQLRGVDGVGLLMTRHPYPSPSACPFVGGGLSKLLDQARLGRAHPQRDRHSPRACDTACAHPRMMTKPRCLFAQPAGMGALAFSCPPSPVSTSHGMPSGMAGGKGGDKRTTVPIFAQNAGRVMRSRLSTKARWG